MPAKLKRLTVDIIIILVTSFFIAMLVNELRRNKIPVLSPYLHNKIYKEMKLNTFKQKNYINSNCFIFDARPHELYRNNHLEGALNFPVTQFDFFYHFYLSDKPSDVPIFVYGKTTSQAFDRELAYRLSLTGHKNITILN